MKKNEKKPQKLPFCKYPNSGMLDYHGIYSLPDELPVLDLEKIKKYRSKRISLTCINVLNKLQIEQFMRLLAYGFSKLGPISRNIVPPLTYTNGLTKDSVHCDVLGSSCFGEWSAENLMYWFFRLFFVTNSTDSKGNIRFNSDVLNNSFVSLNEKNEVIGSVLNHLFYLSENSESDDRKNDIFLDAIRNYLEPMNSFVLKQDLEALKAISDKYPDFKKAYNEKNVACMAFLTRRGDLPVEDTFELFAFAVEHYYTKGFKYVVFEASNQWTGATCEVLNGVRVHFAPTKGKKNIFQSSVPLENISTSPDGYIGIKDSGCMFYIIKLN